MNFNEMKLAIYESYSNGEITRDAASRLINSFENASIDHELDLALEAVDNAESSFMESAIQYSSGEVAQEVFEAEAKSFGDAVKKAWAAFKKWVTDIISKIGKKISDIVAKFTGKEDQKAKVKTPFNLDKMKKFIDDVVSHIKPPFDFADSWWDKIRNKDVPTIIATIGVGAGVTYTVAQRNKLLDGIKDSLMKLSTKLTEIEAKGGDTKGIHLLRSIVSVSNKVVLACATAIKTRSDGTARMNALDESKDAISKGKDADAAHSEYTGMLGRLSYAKKDFAQLNDDIKQAEANCKEKLAALTNLTPDPNNGIYSAAVKAYAAAKAEHETLIKSFPILEKRVKDLQNDIVDFKNDDNAAASKAATAVCNLSADLVLFGHNAVRVCTLDSNVLCHSAIKAKKKNDNAYNDIVKLYYDRIDEAKGLITLTAASLKGNIDAITQMKAVTPEKIFKRTIDNNKKMLAKIDSYNKQISAIEKLAEVNGI